MYRWPPMIRISPSPISKTQMEPMRNLIPSLLLSLYPRQIIKADLTIRRICLMSIPSIYNSYNITYTE